jgi:hypothetical protein
MVEQKQRARPPFFNRHPPVRAQRLVRWWKERPDLLKARSMVE